MATAELSFRPHEIDSNISIGYGVAVADVDGDKKPDILLADKKQFVWYRNPGWEKFVLAENLTEADNVCLAAKDIDGDGKAEVAVGAGWNPSDTVGSGAVFYLAPPEDRTMRWRPIRLQHEPTVHRMRWIRDPSGSWNLAVLPLHGRGNQNGQGAGVKFLAYKFPPKPDQDWPIRVIDDSLHITHNFDLIRWKQDRGDELLIAGREGLIHLTPSGDGWLRSALASEDTPGFPGAGEVRAGKGPGTLPFVVSVEPFHGNQLALYRPRSPGDTNQLFIRQVLDDQLAEGHALASGDLMGVGFDQVVVGWRNKNAQGTTGIKCFIPGKESTDKWVSMIVDGNSMACEDLCLADLNQDGKPDIVASGRATKNVRIYFNETVSKSTGSSSGGHEQ